jgi:DNA primase
VGIVDEDIARVRAATDFVALASEHLALRRAGTRWVGLCPFHSEKSPSFSVNSELGLYYCFGCGAKGDAITFLREVEHLDFAEAVERLAARAGIPLRYDNAAGGGGRDQQRRDRIFDTLDGAISWYHERLLSAPDASKARAYLRRERGYDSEIVRQFRLGWAPEGWNTLLKSLGRSPAELVEAGLATVDEQGRYIDFFRGRILFPIFEAGGKPVGAGGRVLPGGRGPKYKNTSNTAVYDKSQILYGLNWAKKAVVGKGRVVVCEGYTDVIGLQRAGVGEAVATCGTALADGHVKLLKRFAHQIVLAYDADAAGQTAAERFYEWEKRHDVDIRVLALPPGSDPADLARQDPGGVIALVDQARPYLGFRLERLFGRSELSTPEGRARAAAEAVTMVGEHPDPLVRDQYLMQIADRCRVEPDRLRAIAAGGAPTPRERVVARSEDAPEVRLSGPELEALRLAVHRPEEVAARLEGVLFSHPLARSTFDVLTESATLHEAIERADPLAAHLLQRLAVEETDADPDDVMIRLVERAASRELQDLQAELRQAPPEKQPEVAPLFAWVKLALEQMRTDDVTEHGAAVEAEERLVGWIVARHQADGVAVEAPG